jgi:broad specificity phosphatase PhoE
MPRAMMQSKYPNVDFSQCHENWDYEMHAPQAAVQPAERVRKLLRELTSGYQNRLLISHRGLLAFLFVPLCKACRGRWSTTWYTC